VYYSISRPERKEMDYHDETFEDKEVELDGNTYTGCTFKRCIMVITGAAPFHLLACNTFQCVYAFKGAAYRGIHSLHLLYGNGERAAVEGYIQLIRQGPMTIGPDSSTWQRDR
jgi:hypothetical protein